MSDSTEEYPPRFWLYQLEGVRACGWHSFEISVVSRISFYFSSYGITYSQVYVRVVGYQYATSDAIQYGQWKTLRNILEVPIPNITISTYSACVDGISLIHGYPHQRV